MEVLKSISEIVSTIGNTEDKLLEVLIQVQKNNNQNYITEEELKCISKAMNVPFSKAYSVATFYSMISTEKRGKYVVQVCNSAPCYLNGGKAVVEIFKELLGINVGEVTDDGLISLEHTSCIGACDLAPAIKINDDLYGQLNREKITDLVNKIREGEL